MINQDATFCCRSDRIVELAQVGHACLEQVGPAVLCRPGQGRQHGREGEVGKQDDAGDAPLAAQVHTQLHACHPGSEVHIGKQHIDTRLGSHRDCFLCAAAAGDDRDIWKAKFKCADKELAIEGLVLHEENSYRRH